MTRTRHLEGWQDKSLAYLNRVNDTLEDMQEYWPLTLRQLYYRLVGALVIENNIKAYDKLSRMLTKARLQGMIPWESIEDRVRSMSIWRQFADVDEFVDKSKNDFLSGYSRDCLRTQTAAFEIWVEKDALVDLCNRVASRYGIPVVVARGYSSVSYVHDCAVRIKTEWANNNRPTRIIYLGDFDPSGLNMLPTMVHTMTREIGIDNDSIKPIHCALNYEQVQEYDLPRDPEAIKKKDTRSKEFIEQYGQVAVELDALEPQVFMDILNRCIRDNLDLTEYDRQVEQQGSDTEQIEALRERAITAIDQV